MGTTVILHWQVRPTPNLNSELRRRARVFWYRSGKLRRVYDESLEAAAELQKSESATYRIDPIDFGRRIAMEKELVADADAPHQNAIFDESGNFLLYSTVLGVKVCMLTRTLPNV